MSIHSKIRCLSLAEYLVSFGNLSETNAEKCQCDNKGRFFLGIQVAIRKMVSCFFAFVLPTTALWLCFRQE